MNIIEVKNVDLTLGNEKFGFVNCQTGEADMFVSRRD